MRWKELSTRAKAAVVGGGAAGFLAAWFARSLLNLDGARMGAIFGGIGTAAGVLAAALLVTSAAGRR